MAKLRRDKIALFLACASFLGGKTQAAQNVKTGQTVAAVGGEAALKNNKNTLSAMDKSKNATDLSSRKIENKSFINKALDWIKAKPGKAAAIGAGVITAATAAIALPMLLRKSKKPSKPHKLGEGELKKNSNGDNSDALKVKEENQDNNQDNDSKAENIINEIWEKDEKADINNNENKINDAEIIGDKIELKSGDKINGGGTNANKEQKEIIDKKIEAEPEEKKIIEVNPNSKTNEASKEKIKIVQQAAVKNDNIENTKYVQLNWKNVNFSSNGYAAKTATMIYDDKYLKFLKGMYDIKKSFTAGIVNNVYNGYFSKANLIVVDCNCNEFCKKGALKDKNGNLSAYCNGRGQIFILNSGNVSMNYGTKGTGGKWTLEEKDNKYCVDWHTS